MEDWPPFSVFTLLKMDLFFKTTWRAWGEKNQENPISISFAKKVIFFALSIPQSCLHDPEKLDRGILKVLWRGKKLLRSTCHCVKEADSLPWQGWVFGTEMEPVSHVEEAGCTQACVSPGTELKRTCVNGSSRKSRMLTGKKISHEGCCETELPSDKQNAESCWQLGQRKFWDGEEGEEGLGALAAPPDRMSEDCPECHSWTSPAVWWLRLCASTVGADVVPSRDCSTPGFPVLHHLPKFTQIHVHGVGDAIQPPHPLSPSSPLAFNPSQHPGLVQWVSSSHQVAKVVELQFQSF